jgi:predicted metal-dependent phosphoesterase TrpH
VTAGHVKSVHEAFDRYLSAGRPGFVARVGAAPSDVAALVAAAGGITALAHPGRLDESIVVGIVDGGFDAIEVYHPDHDRDDTERLRALARTKNLAVSGGSDFHGTATGKVNALGRIDLPAEAFADLADRAAARGRARG